MSKKLKWTDCEEMAMTILDGWKVKDQRLTRRLADIILKEGKAPNIRIFWNKKTEDLDFEVLRG